MIVINTNLKGVNIYVDQQGYNYTDWKSIKIYVD